MQKCIHSHVIIDVIWFSPPHLAWSNKPSVAKDDEGNISHLQLSDDLGTFEKLSILNANKKQNAIDDS